jgi:hypothetical protein
LEYIKELADVRHYYFSFSNVKRAEVPKLSEGESHLEALLKYCHVAFLSEWV